MCFAYFPVARAPNEAMLNHLCSPALNDIAQTDKRREGREGEMTTEHGGQPDGAMAAMQSTLQDPIQLPQRHWATKPVTTYRFAF